MNINICICLSLLAVIYFLVMHIIHLKYEVVKLNSVLYESNQIVDIEQDRNSEYRRAIAGLEQQLEHRLRQMVEFYSVRSPAPIKYETFNDLSKDKE